MGQRPRKAKCPLYRGTRDDRSNLELIHNRTIAEISKYSQSGMTRIVAGIAFFAFLYVFLEKVIIFGIEIRVLICPIGFLLSVYLGIRKFFLAWANYIDAEFIEKNLVLVIHGKNTS